MRKVRLLLAAAAALAGTALVPLAAEAQLPSTNLPFLVPNDEIGGVRLHARVVKGMQAWGPSRGECTDHACTYQDPRRFWLGYAQFAFEDGRRGKITSISIAVGHDPATGKPVFRTPLASFRSPTGFIHLGSSRRAVKAAFPKAKAVRGAPTFLTLVNRRGDETLFDFAGNRLARVIMRDDRQRG